MPPTTEDSVKTTPSPFDEQVLRVIEEHRGANKGDIELDQSLTEDLGLNPGEIEDLLQVLADHFDVKFNDLKGQHFKTVGEIAVALEELQDFG